MDMCKHGFHGFHAASCPDAPKHGYTYGEARPILEKRAPTHGNFWNTARTTQQLLSALKDGSHILTNSQAEALHMICAKLARIVNGDPNHRDHWDDIAGYATLAARALPKPQAPGLTPDERYNT